MIKEIEVSGDRRVLDWLKQLAALWLLAIAASSAPSTAATEPSFACAAARTAVEKTICKTPYLAEKDVVLADAYKAALAVVPPDDAAAFRAGQRTWLADRGADCRYDAARLAGCLSSDYDDRVAVLRAVVRSPQVGLANILWSTGVVCSGDKALVRFAAEIDPDDEARIAPPPTIGGHLARMAPAASGCRLADGRVVRFKEAPLGDELGYTMCGGDTSYIYSVWIGDRKVVSRERRKYKCGVDPVRAIFYDGRHLTRCADDSSLDRIIGQTCADLSARLRKPVRDRFPDGQFLTSYVAPGMRAFCASMIHGPKLTGEDFDWPVQSAEPADALVVKASVYDLTNDGRPDRVYVAEDFHPGFDGNRLLVAPANATRGSTAATVAKLKEGDPDLVAMRAKGFKIFAGDQTAYRDKGNVRFTPFRRQGTTWLYGVWNTGSLDKPDSVITQPMPDGTQKPICTYWKTPNL